MVLTTIIKVKFLKGGGVSPSRIGEYMRLKDLNGEQLRQLKVQYLDKLLMEKENRNISYGEMVNIDDIISDNDKDFVEEYSCYDFVEDDFFH